MDDTTVGQTIASLHPSNFKMLKYIDFANKYFIDLVHKIVFNIIRFIQL